MKKIEFEIRGLNYEIEDITIQDYYNFRTNLLLDAKEAEFEFISKLSKCPVELLKQISLDDWKVLSFNFNVMVSAAFAENPIVVNQFTHKGVEYGLLDWDKMTIGEFADLDVITNSSNVDNKLHEMLAILYRPIVKKKWKKNIIEDYDNDGFKERCEIFLALPISMVKAVTGFFLHIEQTSLETIKTSSIKMKDPETKEIMKRSEEILMLLQDSGTLQSSNFLEKILLKSKELQDLALKKRSTFSPTETIRSKKKRWNLKKWLKNIIT